LKLFSLFCLAIIIVVEYSFDDVNVRVACTFCTVMGGVSLFCWLYDPPDNPSKVRRCFKCNAYFPRADVREADDPGALDFHCPCCGVRFAHWPKHMC
jgi:hypothetical protein